MTFLTFWRAGEPDQDRDRSADLRHHPGGLLFGERSLVAEGTLVNHSEKDTYEIYLTVDGEPVTETATLAPGAALSGIRLLNVLALGDYDATAHVTAIRDGAISRHSSGGDSHPCG